MLTKAICKRCIDHWAEAVDQPDKAWFREDERAWDENGKVCCPEDCGWIDIDEIPLQCRYRLEYLMKNEEKQPSDGI
jgi:hypothetical protein